VTSVDVDSTPLPHKISSSTQTSQEPLQGKHLQAEVFAEVFSVTKFGKFFKKTSATTSSIGCGGFNGCSI
jgi:hypothetical protein